VAKRGVESPIRRAAKAAGLGPPLRKAQERVRQARVEIGNRIGAVESPVHKRERLDNEHMRLLMAFLISEDSNCIDVGAHEGAMLADMQHLAPEGRHIAYEPLPHLYERLVGRFPDVHVRRAALSDRAGETMFRWVKNMPGMSGLQERFYPAEPEIEMISVRTERLDDTLDDDYVPSFIKIDVEGAEMLVLRGAERTLSRHHPVLVFEYGSGTQYTSYGTRPDEIWMFLSELGYRIFDLDGEGPLSVDAFARSTHWNFVAHL
jgi:FkbM family methyltransferase